MRSSPIDRFYGMARLRFLVGLALGLAFLSLYVAIHRDWQTIAKTNAYFFADTGENIEGLKGFVFGKPLQRHVLFSLFGHPLYLIGNLLCPARALAIPTAILGSASVVLLFSIGCTLHSGIALQTMISILYGFSATNIIYAGIPESYVPTAAFTLVAVLVWIHRSPSSRWLFWLLLSATLVLVGLMNPVVFLFLSGAFTVDALARSDHRSDIWRMFTVGAISGLAIYSIRAILVVSAMPRMKWWETVETSLRYLRGHGSFEHFLSIESISNVVLNTFIFSVAGLPVASFNDADVAAAYSRGFDGLLGYGRMAPGILFLCCSVAIVIVALAHRGNTFGIRHWALPYLIGHVLFFIWFNPGEALLYSPAALGIFFILLFEALHKTPARIRMTLLGILTATVATNNLFMISG